MPFACRLGAKKYQFDSTPSHAQSVVMLIGVTPGGGDVTLKLLLKAVGVTISPVETKFQPLTSVVWNDFEFTVMPMGNCAVNAVFAFTQNPSPGLIVVRTS